MDEEYVRSLEGYLLSETKDQAIQQLKTTHYLKFYLQANSLITKNQADSSQFEDLLKSLSSLNRGKLQEIRLRKLITQFTNASSDSQKSDLIRQIVKDFMGGIPNFDYHPPKMAKQEQATFYPSVLDQSVLGFNDQKIYSNLTQFRKLGPKQVLKLDLSQMSVQIQKQVFRSEYVSSLPGITDCIIQLIESNKFHETEVFKKLSLNQILELEQKYQKIQTYQKFWESKLDKQYLAFVQDSSEREVYQVLKTLHADLQNYSDSQNHWKISNLLSLLSLGPSLGIYDQSYFSQYLSIHTVFNQTLKKPSIPKLNSNKSNLSHQEILTTYCPHLILSLEDVEKYSEFVDRQFLLQQFAENQILKGEDPNSFTEILGKSRIQNLINSIQLEPCLDNQSLYTRIEPVTVSMNVKNIKKLIVRVLEINTAAYFRKFNTPIMTDINLDGLVAQQENTYNYTETSSNRVRRDFEFPSLQGKAGTFVIQFIGSSRYSRALIQKGSLKYVSKVTAAGHLMVILDQNNEVCKKQGAGVIVDGKFFSTENENGRVFIPFCQIQQQKSIVLTDGNISEFVSSFLHLSQNYDLNSAFFVEREQLLIGTRTQIGIKPILFVNWRKAPDSLLYQCQAQVLFTDIEGIVNSKTFKNLEVPKGSDLISLEIEIPPRLGNLQIIFSGYVKTQNGPKRLISTHSIDVNQNLKSTRIFTAQVLARPGQYMVDVRGRNGEPVKNATVQLQFERKTVSQDCSSPLLSTDDEGKVYLGALEGVKSFAANVNYYNDSVTITTNLEDLESQSSYPRLIYLCEGDEFSLPVNIQGDFSDPYFLRLIYSVNGILINQCPEKLSYDESSRILTLDSLQKGNYQLEFGKEKIQIIVIDGHHWGTEFILNQNMAVPTSKQYDTLLITETSVDYQGLKVKLAGNTQNAVIHAFYLNYHDPLIYNIFSTMNFLTRRNYEQAPIVFQKGKSVYLKSILLDQEYRYVLDRKYLPRYSGNILPKPQILLKRLFLQDTTTNAQTALKGEQMLRAAMGAPNSMMAKKASQLQIYWGKLNQTVTDSLDFLEKPGVFYQCLEPNQQGEVVFEVPEHHSEVVLFASNGSCNSTKTVVFQSPQSFRQLRLSQSLSNEHFYTQQLKCKSLDTGENFIIKDISSTQFEIIDNLSKLVKIQNQILKMEGNSVQYQEWSFLEEWNSLEHSKKLEQFQKYSSHQLHLFLKFKDTFFFQEVVVPYLNCKMEKDFIDKYLTGEPLGQFASLKQIQKLNILEKCLLVDRLGEDFTQFKEHLVRNIKDLCSLEKVNYEVRDRQYKSILNSKITQKTMLELQNRDQIQAMDMFLCQSESMSYGAMQSIGARPNMSMKRKAVKRMEKQQSRNSILSQQSDSMCSDILTSSMFSQIPKNYQKMDATKQYIQTYYYNHKQSGLSIPPSQFWAQLAQSFLTHSPLLSDSFLTQGKPLISVTTALSVQNLPFNPERQGYQIKNNQLELTANSPFLIFYKELSQVESNINSEVLLAQRYFDPSDRFVYDQHGAKQKQVSQFIKNHIYGCQVVVTNTSSSHYILNVLTEIPQGSIPITPSISYQNHQISVPSFNTKAVQFTFYFPYSGKFGHFGSNAAHEGTVIAKAQPGKIEVNDYIQVQQYTSFKDFVIAGDKEKILNFIREENVYSGQKEFSWEQIMFLMKQHPFWLEVIQILRQRRIFVQQIWRMAIFHQDAEVFAELLSMESIIQESLGPNFSSGVIETGKLSYIHRQFDPLVNPRAYTLGNKPRITNTRFHVVYQEFLVYLSSKPVLQAEDYICWALYMILQDRYYQAADLYSRIHLEYSSTSPGRSNLQIQFDYITCFLDIEKAKIIAPLYQNYPVQTWKNYFKQVRQLLAQLEGKFEQETVTIVKEPTLDFSVQENTLKLYYENVVSCKIRYYEVDLEVLFSKQPFFIEGVQDFSYVKANIENQIQLDIKGSSEVPLPEVLVGRNILIEVDYSSYLVCKSYFACLLRVNVIERYGIVKVSDQQGNGKAECYVKAFVRKRGGQVEFYKDGYTDIRGKFNYVSLNVDVLSSIQEFSILIVDDNLGSQVVKANPPPQ